MARHDQLTAASLPRRAAQNYTEMFRAFARVSPDGAIREIGGVTLARTGPLLPMLNTVIVADDAADPETVLADARAWFAPTGQRYAITTLDAATDRLAPALRRAGREPHASPLLIWQPDARPEVTATDLRIEPARDGASLRRYNDTMTAAFGGVWAMPGIVRDETINRPMDVTHYIGYLADAPVATAMLFCSHRIAGVFNVGTIPAARRRGIGAALTRRAVADGLAVGCVASALQASEMGLSMYLRLGYRQVGTYTVWLAS